MATNTPVTPYNWLTEIADALRKKSVLPEGEETQGKYLIDAINNIELIHYWNTWDLSVSVRRIGYGTDINATYDAEEEGLDGYSSVMLMEGETVADITGLYIEENNKTYYAFDEPIYDPDYPESAPIGYYKAYNYAELSDTIRKTISTTKDISIFENGSFNIAEDDSKYEGYYNIYVSVPTPKSLKSKVVTENGTYIAEDDLVDCYDSVTVNVQGNFPDASKRRF